MDAAIDDLLERHQGAMTKAEYAAAATEIQALILAERERCAKLLEHKAANWREVRDRVNARGTMTWLVDDARATLLDECAAAIREPV